MWQNKGAFGSNGQFQNNFSPDAFSKSSFTGQAMPGQQYFPQLPNTVQYGDANGDAFEPEVGLFNNGSFSQNQLMSGGSQYSPAAHDNRPPVAPASRPPPAHISARAAALKAQLLASRANSGTPPVHSNLASAAKQTTRAEDSTSLRASPKTPTTINKQEQELDLTELISQYSEPKAAATGVKKEIINPDTSGFQRIPTHMGGKPRAFSLESPTKVLKPVNNGSNTGGDLGEKVNNTASGRTLGKRHASNGSVSEGDILEEQQPNPKATTKALRPKLKEAQYGGKISKPDEPISRRSGDEHVDKPYRRLSRDESPPRRPPPTNPIIQVSRNRDGYLDEVDMRAEKRSYQPEYKERDMWPDTQRPAYQRRDSRREEDTRKPETIEKKREVVNRSVREQKPSVLSDLLPLDEDLREWLEITGYHNITYRSKILNRRRAIAALDAQRDQLLAEMEQDERGGVPPATGSQPLPSTMLPPPIPNTVGGRAEAASIPAVPSDTSRDRVITHKRPHSDVDEQRSEVNGGGKLARTNDRGYQSRMKEEDEPEYRRPRSGVYDTPRRSPDIERRERELSSPRYGPRGRSRERDSSPGSGRRAFENRPAARGRGYDSDSFWDREDFPEPRGRGGFEVRGNYRGRAYDPNYRARGRGRGRGDSREGRDFSLWDVKMDTGYGSKIANGKPFKDTKGFNRGGRGETRYFIVKSFNEENVLRCIQDARMESLPSSIPTPTWQRSIHWESTGAFRVRWLVVCATRFQRIGHLKNALNDGLAVLIGKDGQEIDEACGESLCEAIDEEADMALSLSWGRVGV
ncbi:hypothetical protein WAI453_008434 [Rhynchosporium graminicola]